MLFADLLPLHLSATPASIIPTLFLCFLLICYPCMKFAIYYRAASLPSQASYARA